MFHICFSWCFVVRKLKVDKPPKTSKLGKKKKGGGLPEGAPKKPLGSYFMFAGAKRQELTQSDPSLSITEV